MKMNFAIRCELLAYLLDQFGYKAKEVVTVPGGVEIKCWPQWAYYEPEMTRTANEWLRNGMVAR